MRVRVTMAGPLKGEEGTIVEPAGCDHFRIALDTVSYATLVLFSEEFDILKES